MYNPNLLPSLLPLNTKKSKKHQAKIASHARYSIASKTLKIHPSSVVLRPRTILSTPAHEKMLHTLPPHDHHLQKHTTTTTPAEEKLPDTPFLPSLCE